MSEPLIFPARTERKNRDRPASLGELCDRMEAWIEQIQPARCAAHGAEDCRECEREAERRQREAFLNRDRAGALKKCGVPSRYLRDFPAWARMDWSGEPWAVVVQGEVGAGKTFHAVELLWRWCRPRGDIGRFVRAASIPGLAYGEDRETYERSVRLPLVLVDDLGRGYKGDATQAVGEFVAFRFDRELPTIFTTNAMTELQIGDPATVDRLRDALCITLRGESRRGRS